jgi:DeoR family L-fucose operon activator
MKAERQEEILDLILRDKCSNVKELTSVVYASPATIRRDLRELESKGLVRLQYGNIIPLAEARKELPLAFRENQSKESKRNIARFAASLIAPNSSVMLDASSSALYMADYIQPDAEITVFTNCIKTAIKLCENNVTVYIMGGKIHNRNFVTSGSWTETNVESIYVDYCFFSSKALDTNGDISGESESGVNMRRCMIERASKQYFLCNYEKVGKKSTFLLCNASKLTGVIVDGDLSDMPNINAIRVP